jgi:hypothetical protein
MVGQESEQELDDRMDSARLQARIGEPQPLGADTTPGDFEFVYEPTGRILGRIGGVSRTRANAALDDVRRRYDDLQPADIVMRRVTPGVQDIPMDVAQNVGGPARQEFELYPYDDPTHVLHRMTGTVAEVMAWIDQQERNGMPPGFIRARNPANESRTARKLLNDFDSYFESLIAPAKKRLS